MNEYVPSNPLWDAFCPLRGKITQEDGQCNNHTAPVGAGSSRGVGSVGGEQARPGSEGGPLFHPSSFNRAGVGGRHERQRPLLPHPPPGWEAAREKIKSNSCQTTKQKMKKRKVRGGIPAAVAQPQVEPWRQPTNGLLGAFTEWWGDYSEAVSCKQHVNQPPRHFPFQVVDERRNES